MKSPIRDTHVKIIGLTGAKGVGKDTCGKYLCETYAFNRVSFADPLKRALVAMFDVPMELFEDPKLKETPDPRLLGKTPRFLMETLGTEWGRDIVDKNMWVDLGMLKADRLLGEALSVIVTDVRFDGEAEAIKQRGGYVWLIERENTGYAPTKHVSNAGINRDLVDFVVSNNADRRMLYAQLGVGLAHIDKTIPMRSHDGSTVGTLPTV